MNTNKYEVCFYSGGQVSASEIVEATSYAQARLLAKPKATALGMSIRRPNGTLGLVVRYSDQLAAANA